MHPLMDKTRERPMILIYLGWNKLGLVVEIKLLKKLNHSI